MTKETIENGYHKLELFDLVANKLNPSSRNLNSQLMARESSILISTVIREP